MLCHGVYICMLESCCAEYLGFCYFVELKVISIHVYAVFLGYLSGDPEDVE